MKKGGLEFIASKVKGAKIEKEPGKFGMEYVTVDGSRQVIFMLGRYDLWVKKRKPGVLFGMADDVKPWAMGVSADKAEAFLLGWKKDDVLNLNETA